MDLKKSRRTIDYIKAIEGLKIMLKNKQKELWDKEYYVNKLIEKSCQESTHRPCILTSHSNCVFN